MKTYPMCHVSCEFEPNNRRFDSQKCQILNIIQTYLVHTITITLQIYAEFHYKALSFYIHTKRNIFHVFTQLFCYSKSHLFYTCFNSGSAGFRRCHLAETFPFIESTKKKKIHSEKLIQLDYRQITEWLTGVLLLTL